MGTLRAVALALTLALPVVASAQSPKDKQKASELVKQAIAKSQAGEHDVAIEKYLEAYKLIPTPLLLSNIASEYKQVDKPVESLKYFCMYLEAEPTGNMASYATAQAKTLYVELGGIDTVEDKDVCKPIVKPEADKPDEPEKVGGGDEVKQPPPPPPPEPEGPKASPLRWVGVGLGVVGVGMFGFGVYEGTQAKKISDDITNHDPADPWPSNINELEAEGQSHEKKQIGFMIGGALAIGGGVALFFLGAPKATSEGATVSVTPVATPDTLGFAATGRF